jgi:hypothetical protein
VAAAHEEVKRRYQVKKQKTKRAATAPFNAEWDVREALMKLAGASVEEIAAHRKEILHMYGLKEEDVAKRKRI